MKKKINYKKLLLLVPFVLIYMVVLHVCSNAYHADWEKNKSYLWIFKNSIKNQIDPSFSSSWVRKSDVINNYLYMGHYVITVWDFKYLSSLNLNDIFINSNVESKKIDLDHLKGEILDPGCNPETVIKYGVEIHEKMQINLDDSSEIIKKINANNYKGFYGIVNNVTLSNESNQECIQFLYPDGRVPTLLIIYKSTNGLYLIKVESNDNKDYKFDENILEIFNLKK